MSASSSKKASSSSKKTTNIDERKDSTSTINPNDDDPSPNTMDHLDHIAYIKDMDQACAAASEMEHYFTTAFWPHAFNKPWRKTPSNEGWCAPMIPPDLDEMLKKAEAGHDYDAEAEDLKGPGEGFWGAFFAVMSPLWFPLRDSTLCSWCCKKRKKKKWIDPEKESHHEKHETYETGFDYYFKLWMANVKPNEWPLREGTRRDVETADMTTITRHFSYFIYQQNQVWVGKCLIANFLKGIFGGIQSILLGLITGEVSKMVSHHDTGVAKPSLWPLAIYCILYWARFEAYAWSDWWYQMSVPAHGMIRNFRYVMVGRMLKFKPIPEAANCIQDLMNGINNAMSYCWFPIFTSVETISQLITSLVILGTMYKNQIFKNATFALILLPVLAIIFAVWANYYVRLRNAADLIRRKYQWRQNTMGYCNAVLEQARHHPYNLDQDVTSTWRVLSLYFMRWFHVWSFSYVAPKFLQHINMLIIVGMIFFTGSQASEGTINVTQFTTITGTLTTIVAMLQDFMTMLMNIPIGYEGILRMAKIINNSNLKCAYKKPIGGFENETVNEILSLKDIRTLLHMNPDNLNKDDMRKLKHMNLSLLRPEEKSRLGKLGIDVLKFHKVTHWYDTVVNEVKSSLGHHGSNKGSVATTNSVDSSSNDEPIDMQKLADDYNEVRMGSIVEEPASPSMIASKQSKSDDYKPLAQESNVAPSGSSSVMPDSTLGEDEKKLLPKKRNNKKKK